LLTEANKLLRVFYAANRINTDVVNLDGSMFYHSSDDEVHVDEKWFFLTEIDQGLYLTEAEEKGPDRSTRHKGHILKVMFLTAVARPA
jgi:hypothetical protein